MKFSPGVVPQWPEQPRLDVLDGSAARAAAGCRAGRSGRRRGSWRPASTRSARADRRRRAVPRAQAGWGARGSLFLSRSGGDVAAKLSMLGHFGSRGREEAAVARLRAEAVKDIQEPPLVFGGIARISTRSSLRIVASCSVVSPSCDSRASVAGTRACTWGRSRPILPQRRDRHRGRALGRRAEGSACFQRMGPGRRPGRAHRVLHPRPARLPHLHGPPAGAEDGRRLPGPRSLHRQGHPEGPAGVPAQRAHGVRVGVRPRRVSRARLHRRLPAPRVRSGQALLRRSRLGLRRAQDDRGLPHQPLRREDQDARR